jgi:type II secretion system protein G
MKKRGFTLIELMVVVVIIGILAAIAIPNFVRIVDRAKEASVKANMHTLQTTVEAMSIDHMGRYPSSSADDASVSAELPGNFANPYNGDKTGDAVDYAAQATTEGNVGYDADGSTYAATSYTITGAGKEGAAIDLTLTPGQ